MADQPAPKAKGGTFGFLTRKVGPLPVWLWGALAYGGYYWYTHYGPGAQKQAAAVPQQRPQVIIVKGKTPRSHPVPAPAPQPAPPPKPRIHPVGTVPPKRKRRQPAAPPTIQPVPVQQPVTAAAPMTAGDVYGDIPTASPDGSTYDSGYPSDAQMSGAYVPAG